jgi:hypothetical protein
VNATTALPAGAPPPGAPPPAGPPAAAPVPTDPFSGAKANLRDTVKWLATTFAGLAAVVVAGASLTGVSQLKGVAMATALTGAAVGLLCVIAAAGVMLRLLTTNTFFASDLSSDKYPQLRQFLDQHAIDFLPAELPSVQALLEARLNATRDAHRYQGNPNSNEYLSASGYLAQLQAPLSRLTNLAQLEFLRRDLNAKIPWLFALAVGALLGLGVFAVYSAPPKDASAKRQDACCCVTTGDKTPGGGKAGDAAPCGTPPVGAIVPLNPLKDWSRLATVFAVTCGDKVPIEAEILASGQPGWVNVRLLEPEKCKGVVLPLPVESVIPTATPPKQPSPP